MALKTNNKIKFANYVSCFKILETKTKFSLLFSIYLNTGSKSKQALKLQIKVKKKRPDTRGESDKSVLLDMMLSCL